MHAKAVIDNQVNVRVFAFEKVYEVQTDDDDVDESEAGEAPLKNETPRL